MGWPKGVKRVGYVKPDGTPHAKRGSKVTTRSLPRQKPTESKKKTVVTQTATPEVSNLPRGKNKRLSRGQNSTVSGGITIRKVSGDLGPVSDPNHPSDYAIHGDRPGRPVIEKCPNCWYAYADGGWCSECGWTAPINAKPYGTVTGRKFQ